MEIHEVARIQKALENAVSFKKGRNRKSIAEVAEQSGLSKGFLTNFRRGTSREATQVEILSKWLKAEGYMPDGQPADFEAAKERLTANIEQVLEVLRDPTADNVKVVVELAWLAKTLGEQLGVLIGNSVHAG